MTTESAGQISPPPLWELGLRVVQKQLLLTILMNYKFVNGLARILEKSGLNADEFRTSALRKNPGFSMGRIR